MHCPFCQHEDTRVIDSRLGEDGHLVRRRRECPACNGRFNTLESAELKLPAIVKQDGRREMFSERKLRSGLEPALHKRPVESAAIDRIIADIIDKLRRRAEREVPSRQIGEWLMEALRSLDQIAYVRFASVYRSFQDVQAFLEACRSDFPIEYYKDGRLRLDDRISPGSSSRICVLTHQMG